MKPAFHSVLPCGNRAEVNYESIAHIHIWICVYVWLHIYQTLQSPRHLAIQSKHRLTQNYLIKHWKKLSTLMKCWTVPKINVFWRVEVLSFCSAANGSQDPVHAEQALYPWSTASAPSTQTEDNTSSNTASLTNMHTHCPDKNHIHSMGEDASCSWGREWKGWRCQLQARGFTVIGSSAENWPRLRGKITPKSKFSFICIDLK